MDVTSPYSCVICFVVGEYFTVTTFVPAKMLRFPYHKAITLTSGQTDTDYCQHYFLYFSLHHPPLHLLHLPFGIRPSLLFTSFHRTLSTFCNTSMTNYLPHSRSHSLHLPPSQTPFPASQLTPATYTLVLIYFHQAITPSL